MFKKYNWKQPVFKNDIKSVLLCGFIYALLSGILCGGLDYLMDMLNVPISFTLIIISYAVGSRINKGYYSFHILYPVLAVLFLLLGLIFSSITYSIFAYQFDFSILLNPFVYITAIIEPFINILLFINNRDILYLLYGILDIMIYGFAIWYCYKLAKGRN